MACLILSIYLRILCYLWCFVYFKFVGLVLSSNHGYPVHILFTFTFNFQVFIRQTAPSMKLRDRFWKQLFIFFSIKLTFKSNLNSEFIFVLFIGFVHFSPCISRFKQHIMRFYQLKHYKQTQHIR